MPHSSSGFATPRHATPRQYHANRNNNGNNNQQHQQQQQQQQQKPKITTETTTIDTTTKHPQKQQNNKNKTPATKQQQQQNNGNTQTTTKLRSSTGNQISTKAKNIEQKEEHEERGGRGEGWHSSIRNEFERRHMKRKRNDGDLVMPLFPESVR